MSTRRPYRVDYAGRYRQRSTTHASDLSAEAAIEAFLHAEAEEWDKAAAYLTRYDDDGQVLWAKRAHRTSTATAYTIEYERPTEGRAANG